MNKYTVLWIVLIIVVGAGAFFGGMKYQQSQQPSFRQFGANMQNSGRIGSGGQNGARMRMGGGQVMGEIISQDDKSITVKLQDGSSKIIILSDKTSINKATSGSKLDLTSGVRVAVFGTANTDGSVTAQMIQINPISRGLDIINRPTPATQ